MEAAAAMIREARRTAGLSQASLASRVGMPQSALARLERPGSNPTWDTLSRVLSAAGHELTLRKQRAGRSSIDQTLVFENLRLSPGERIKAFERSYRNVREFALATRDSLGRST